MNFKSQIMNSIGFSDSEPNNKIAVAMSGGVDSSVTAALLNECGYHVFGISMYLYDTKIDVNNKKTCCAGIDINDAKKVCNQLGIKHFVFKSIHNEEYNNHQHVCS